jgi:sugar/nucleoside kinase (ribokinase family)
MAASEGEMRIVTMGVHVLDVLVRPVDQLPEGLGELVEEIKITAAGAAGGTAVTLAKLGAEVRSAGAIGSDATGEMLVSLLEHGGVDTKALLRRSDVSTSASVLPIRSNGDRPALHVVGANATYGPGDVDWGALGDDVTHLHLGGPEFMGGDAAAEILAAAQERGIATSADILAPGDPGLLEWIAAALPHLDLLLPNQEQVLGFTGADDLAAGCHALRDRGVACVAATAGAEGAMVVDENGITTVPAFPIEVVDTTGCGDAFSAGFLRGRSLGGDAASSARLGCAAASFVAEGLGSDFGEFDLAACEQRAKLSP